MARPTKYNSKLQEKADQYLDQYEENGDLIPTVEGLCITLDIRTVTAYDWAKSKPEFSNTLDRIKTHQKQGLINGALSGAYNSAIAKLLLSHNHGVKETSATEISGADGDAIKTDNTFTIKFVK